MSSADSLRRVDTSEGEAGDGAKKQDAVTSRVTQCTELLIKTDAEMNFFGTEQMREKGIPSVISSHFTGWKIGTPLGGKPILRPLPHHPPRSHLTVVHIAVSA